MQKIESIKHAFEITRRDPKQADFSSLPRSERKAFRSLYEITTAIKAQNKLSKWKADFTNHNQPKYYPFMKVIERKNKTGSGLGLAYYDYNYSLYGTTVGSRLCVGTNEECEHIAKLITSRYEDWMLE